MLYQAPWYPYQAHENVYDFPLINETVKDLSLKEWSKPNGCRDLILECRKLGDELDPDEFGVSSKVNKVCLDATELCAEYLIVAPITPPFSIPSVGHVSLHSKHLKSGPTVLTGCQ